MNLLCEKQANPPIFSLEASAPLSEVFVPLPATAEFAMTTPSLFHDNSSEFLDELAGQSVSTDPKVDKGEVKTLPAARSRVSLPDEARRGSPCQSSLAPRPSTWSQCRTD